MKTALKIISEITVSESNLQHIALSGKINGSLLLDIQTALKEYGKQVGEQVLKDAAENAKAHTESNFESVHYCSCIPCVNKESILNTEIKLP